MKLTNKLLIIGAMALLVVSCKSKDYSSEPTSIVIKAAEKGNAHAQNELGRRFCDGDGVEQDYTEAVKWLRKAAEQGFEPAKEALDELEKPETDE